MPLLGKSVETLLGFDEKQLWGYFCHYAGYIPREAVSLNKEQYGIRVGNKTLYAKETGDLHTKFISHIAALKEERKTK